jgi:hypothetical protein
MTSCYGSREPMSFTHGDFGDDYLERLALGSDLPTT